MKQGIYFLLLIFVLNGCVHRGHTLELTTQTAIERYSEQSSDTKLEMQQSSSIPSVEKENFFDLNDTTKNNISGALILIIGLILVL